MKKDKIKNPVQHLNKDIDLAAVSLKLIGGHDGKLQLIKFTYYTLLLICLLPYIIALALPYGSDLASAINKKEITPYYKLGLRSVTSLATGSFVAFILITIFLLLRKIPKLQKAWVFSILPLTLVTTSAQVIMYKLSLIHI